jgi:hypothetical protein
MIIQVFDFVISVIPAQAGIQSKQWFTGCRVKPGMTKSKLIQSLHEFDIDSSFFLTLSGLQVLNNFPVVKPCVES